MFRADSTTTIGALRKELLCCLVLVCSISHAAGLVQCTASSICAVGPDDNLGVAMSGESCCLDNPSALAYVPVGSEECIRCIVVGFINASFSGVEQGSRHSIAVGYLKGGTIAGQNLLFNVTNTPGTAREGSRFDYIVDTARVRATANGQIANVVLTFRVDIVALEPNETFTLTLNPLIALNPREGLFFRDTIEVTIIDSDNVEFSFTEDDYRANEEGRNGSLSFMPIFVYKSTRIASRVELVVVPLTIQEARETSVPLSPNVPTNNSRSPPFASLNDFNNTNITLIFEPDENTEVNEIKRAPIFVIGDAINEAPEQVFVAELILINSSNAASVTLTRPSTLCRIIDNDPIRVGFEVPGYTYTEPAFDRVVDQFFVSATGRPENGPIYVIKEDNVTSEQTFLVSVQVTDSAPSGFQTATFGQDYRVPAHTHSILFNAFEQRIPFAFTLLADTLPEGTEAFQLSVSPEDTGDIGGGTEQFPTFRNPITLASEVFITIDVIELITIGFADASYTVNESVGTFQVDVQVFNPTDDQPLPPSVYFVIQTVSGTATGGSDYQEIKASQLDVLLTFDNNNRRQSFSVAIVDDQLVEGTESFTLELRFDPFLMPHGSNILLSPNVSVVTVLDDDDPATTVSPPSLPPPIGVQGLCSIVVWYSPAVSCEDIRGYEVRLYHPQSPHLNMTSFVGANGTFYMVDEEKLVSSDETFIQVRAIHQTGVGEWSEGSSLGCEKPTAPEKPPTVHFELNGKVYLNNSAIAISEIGEGANALYCRTDKEECCGVVPNRFGQFYYPSGVQVPIASRRQGFYRNRGDQIIRLNRREGITSPTGTYRCEIPNADDETVRIYITLTGN